MKHACFKNPQYTVSILVNFFLARYCLVYIDIYVEQLTCDKKCTLYLYLLLQKLMQYHTIVLLNNHNKEYNYILVHLTILNNKK